MGNRAVIVGKELGQYIYLHWNGGRDSVETFLLYCSLREFRAPPDGYGWARLAQVIGNYFEDGLSVGAYCCNGGDPRELDPGDNGVYIIDGWTIVDRIGCSPEEEQWNYDVVKFLKDLNSCQPTAQQLSEEAIDKACEGFPTETRYVVYDGAEQIPAPPFRTLDEARQVSERYWERCINPPQLHIETREFVLPPSYESFKESA